MHHTQEREQKIRLWLDMWLRREDLGILELFAPDAVYLESWGPEYHGAAAIRHWFQEWRDPCPITLRNEVHHGT